MDGVRALRAVDAPQQPALVVVVHERLRIAVVDAQALADRLGTVVLAALPATGDPLYDDVVGHVDEHDGGQLAPARLEPGGQRLRLLDRARKPVEQDRPARQFRQRVAHHRE